MEKHLPVPPECRVGPEMYWQLKKSPAVEAGDFRIRSRLRRGGRERLLEVVDHAAGLLDRELLRVG